MITKYTELVRCPNCGKMASKGNFCEHCTLKMVKKCTCWQAGTIKEKYCNGKYCPGFEAYTQAMLAEEYHKLYQLPLFSRGHAILRLLYRLACLEAEQIPRLMKHNAHYLKVNLLRYAATLVKTAPPVLGKFIRQG